MDKIKEVMGLVRRHAQEAVNSCSDESVSRDGLNESWNAIESKLRELLEREPLSEDEICTMLGIDGSDDWTYTVARAVERAHGIGNESKEM